MADAILTRMQQLMLKSSDVLVWRNMLVTGILVLGLLQPTLSTAADRGAVDAVLIIDSSGSMKETDPRRLRVPAAKMFVSLLSKQDRIGLISFSDNGYPVVHLTPATSSNRDLLFKGVEKVSAKGAYTNLHAALLKGMEMLQAEGDKNRRRMLVLMSDGKMDTGDWDNDQSLTKQIRTQLIDKLASEGIEVYTIAFTEASDMTLMHEVAERTQALSRMASNDRELHQVFSQIFESAKQPDMLPIDGGEFMVDDAVEEVTVVASKAAADVEILLHMPDGRKIAAANAGPAVRWFRSEQFDMITIDKPPAGKWRLVASDDRSNRAYVVTNLSMDARIGKPPILLETEQAAEAWLQKDGEVLTSPEILGQTQFMLELTQPDGTVVETPLADAAMTGDRAGGDGVYSNLLAFAQPGQYRVRAIAKAETFQREKALFIEVMAPEGGATPKPVAAPAEPAPEPVPEAEPQPVAEPVVETPPVEEPAVDAPVEEMPPAAEPEKGLNVGLIVSLFVLVNIFIGAAVGGFLFWRKRKAAKAAASAPVEDEA